MVSTKIRHSVKKPDIFRGDVHICCLTQDKKGKLVFPNGYTLKELESAVSWDDFKGEVGDSLLVYVPNIGKAKDKTARVLFVGLGMSEGKNTNELRELCRNVGGNIAAEIEQIRASVLHLTLPCIQTMDGKDIAECFVEGIMLGDYRFLKYKKESEDNPSFKGIKTLTVYADKGGKSVLKGMKKAYASSLAACKARDMANEPGNSWTPTSFASYAEELSTEYNMTCTVLGKAQMKRLKMGGILGVNQGSSEAPKMIVLEYSSKKPKAQTLMIVGKGLTFDSGGISIKPSAGMQDMKYDMCGGAAVLSTMAVIGEEKPDVNVVAIIPSTDNMSGSSALKPGDVIRHYGGITSEVVNTDAEGRLILADALAYGIEKFKPNSVIDLATLTGAVILGLGHHRTGILGNNQILLNRVLKAGEKCGEPLWQLPLDKEYTEQIDSDVADIKNTGGRPAGTITAAAYLQKFVGDTPWVHLDIAGTAWDFTKKSYIPKGPSGTGVRTLVELVRDWKGFTDK